MNSDNELCVIALKLILARTSLLSQMHRQALVHLCYHLATSQEIKIAEQAFFIATVFKLADSDFIEIANSSELELKEVLEYRDEAPLINAMYKFAQETLNPPHAGKNLFTKFLTANLHLLPTLLSLLNSKLCYMNVFIEFADQSLKSKFIAEA